MKRFTFLAIAATLVSNPTAFACGGAGGGGGTTSAAALSTGTMTVPTTGLTGTTFAASPVQQQSFSPQLAYQQYLQQQFLAQQARQHTIAAAELKQHERERKIAQRKERETERLAKIEANRARNLARRAERMATTQLASRTTDRPTLE